MRSPRWSTGGSSSSRKGRCRRSVAGTGDPWLRTQPFHSPSDWFGNGRGYSPATPRSPAEGRKQATEKSGECLDVFGNGDAPSVVCTKDCDLAWHHRVTPRMGE